MADLRDKKIIIFLFLASTLLFSMGIFRSLSITDEACYANVAKEMFKSGDWMSFTQWGRPFYEKPPLLFWIMGFFYMIFGINIFAARIAVVFFGAGSVILTYLLGLELFGKEQKKSAFLAGLMVLTTPSIITYSHGALMDVPLLFFILLGLYFFLLSEKKPYYGLYFGIALGLGIMMKGPMALVMVFAAGSYIILRRKWMYFKNIYLYAGFLLTILIVFPWHLYEIQKNGKLFIDEYFGRHIFKRMSTSLHPTVVNRAFGILFYPLTLLINFLPWSFFILQALRKDIKNSLVSDRSAFVASFVIINLIALTFVQTHLDQYSVIFYPFLALSAGKYLSDAVEKPEEHKVSFNIVFSVFIALALILIGASFVVLFKFKEYIIYLIPALIFAGLLLFFALSYFLRSKFFDLNDKAVKIFTLCLFLGWTVSLAIVPFWDYHSDFKGFISKAKKILPQNEIVCGIVPDRILYMRDPLHFYLDNTIKDIGQENIRAVFDYETASFIITHKEIYEKNDYLIRNTEMILGSKEWVLLKKRVK